MKDRALKITRRIRVSVVVFESHGIERGDRAIVAMSGDVRVGELGYFETGSYFGGVGCSRELRSHRWFAFLCDQDATCHEWIERGSGICLRSRMDRCEGEHGAEPHDDDDLNHGGVLVEIYGRIVVIERNGAAVETSLAFRSLDEREQATTAIAPRSTSENLSVVRPARDPNALPSVEKRMRPLTSEQHEEIARLIRSSMDSTAKNPTPALSREGCIVVRREVTTLARVAGVRRLKSHATAFRRALAEFERKLAADSIERADERAGRLAIEHLWRWLHGYTKPRLTDEWPDTIGTVNEPEPQLASESPSDAIGDGNIVDLGERMEVGGKSIPVLHIKKWLREVHPQTVRILCCGPPGDPLWYGRDKTHALYAAICGDKVRELSLEHGGMVCEKHANPEYCVDLEGTGGHWASDGNGTLALVITSQTERANLILERIEKAAFKYWRKNKPEPNFATWFNEIWIGLATSLTSQVRYSCEPALYGKDCSMNN